MAHCVHRREFGWYYIVSKIPTTIVASALGQKDISYGSLQKDNYKAINLKSLRFMIRWSRNDLF